jgi:hypothetical protein
MTSIQRHFDMYASGLWECPNTGILLTLEEHPYTQEELKTMEESAQEHYEENYNDFMWDMEFCCPC